MRLNNKVAIITGGVTGIGLEVAKEFIKNNAKIVICGYDENDVLLAKENLLKEYPNASLLAYKVDITKTEEIERLFKHTYNKFGKIDVLINNAGIAPACSIENTKDDDFFNVINTNTIGTFKCTREAVKYMKETGGSIINTSSIVGIYGSPNQSAYSASKAAIIGLTKSNAKELGKYNIRVNSIAPGVILTNMVYDNCNMETIERLKMITPLGRNGYAKDLTSLFVYLASDESTYTTGAIINVDGGLTM